jgi:DNA invertase Pin-like site-specific DNA recombinase
MRLPMKKLLLITAFSVAHTTTPHGRLILTDLGGAGFERELIRARTADGRDLAKTRGIHTRGVHVGHKADTAPAA